MGDGNKTGSGRLKRPERQVFPADPAGHRLFAGIIFWGGFNTAMEATNTSSSASRATRCGIRSIRNTSRPSITRTGPACAICSDCHVPKDWVPKMARRSRASQKFMARSWVPSIPRKVRRQAPGTGRRSTDGPRKKARDRRNAAIASFEGMNVEKQRPASKMHGKSLRTTKDLYRLP